MKKSVYILMAMCFLLGCKNNPSSSRTELNEEEFKEFNEAKNQEGMIAIETTFEPTLELTDEIRNSTLEELIRQRKGKLSKADQAKQETYRKEMRNKMKKEGLSDDQINSSPYSQLGPSHQYVSPTDNVREYKLKYVPATSNLAKVYYLEDMGRFIEHNETYYNSIMIKMQEDSQSQQEQKNWDKYL